MVCRRRGGVQTGHSPSAARGEDAPLECVLEADGHVAEDTLRLFDATIWDTAAQLTALGNMQVFAEKPMASGSWLDVSTTSEAR